MVNESKLPQLLPINKLCIKKKAKKSNCSMEEGTVHY